MGGGHLMFAIAALVALAAACSAPTSSQTTTSASTPTTSSAVTGAPDAVGTVWLCRPGLAHDPCTANLTTTVVRADGTRSIQRTVAAKHPPIDCFYVYPTVSRQSTPNANLHIDPAETAVAVDQASRFSQVCRVYAPMYPQLTLAAIGAGGKQIPPDAAVTAYLGVLAAWKDYLAHDNHGRGVVLIGHSQGASMLIALMRNQIDPNAAERKLLVSALLMGGNVTVPAGKSVGGDFQHIPACRSDRQVGCVVAYSSFDTVPPADSLFGRVGTSIGARSGLGTTSEGGLQVLCTNPASLGGGTASLDPYFLTTSFPGAGGLFNAPTTPGVSTPWVSYPARYDATCMDSGGASWLQVTAATSGDHRPVVSEVLGPLWGLHLVDVNLALGDLVPLVRDQASAYTS